MANARVDKVNAELKRSIYEILSKKVKSQELTEMFSIVKVDTDKELTYAKVYVSVFSADKEKADLRRLSTAKTLSGNVCLRK